MGQTFASSTMVCVEHNNMSKMPEMSMMAHHTMMDMDMGMQQVDPSSMDCCDKQCKCPESGCSTVVFVALATIDSAYQILGSKPSTRLSSPPLSKRKNSLYRPPIS
jgi:uncharacterized protein involved in copper resistance